MKIMIKKIAKKILPRKAKIYLRAKIRNRKLLRHPRMASPRPDTLALDCLIAYNDYGGYCIPKHSMQRISVQKTLRGEIHEKETIDYIEEMYSGGDIIHAGAYFGDFLPKLSRICGKKGFVWAFEPNQENFECARITCLINRLENVKISNSALSYSNKSMKLIVQDGSGCGLGGASYVAQPNEDINKNSNYQEVVSCIKLDDVVEDRRVSIIHLDIEGFEQSALTGAINVIRRDRPLIIVETVPNSEWIKKYLAPLQYLYNGKIHRNFIYKSI